MTKIEERISLAFRRNPNAVMDECMSDISLAESLYLGAPEGMGHCLSCDECFETHLSVRDALAMAICWEAELGFSNGVTILTPANHKRYFANFPRRRSQRVPGLIAAEGQTGYARKPNKVNVPIGGITVKMEFGERNGLNMMRLTPNRHCRLIAKLSIGAVLAAADLDRGESITLDIDTDGKAVQVYAIPIDSL